MSLRALLLASTLVLSACSSEAVPRPVPPVNWASLDAPPPAPTSAPTAATKRERHVADAYLAAISSPDFSPLMKLLDDEAHFTFAGFHDVRGRENVVEMHRSLLSAFTPRSFEARRVLLNATAQSVEWTMEATQAATQKRVVLRGATLLFTRDDGAITDVHVFFDEGVLNAQFGPEPRALKAAMATGVLSGADPGKAQRVDVEEARSPDERANTKVVSQSLDALESKNEAAYLGAMTDDVEVVTSEATKPAHGKDEARAYLRAMHKAIAQLDTSIDNLWGVGDFVVVEYHVVGEQRGPILWVPAQKDNLVKMFVLDVVKLEHGKIARVWRYDNPAQLVSVTP